MKNVDELERVMERQMFFYNLSEQVRSLINVPSKKYAFCFHCHYRNPRFSVWPENQSPNGDKQCTIEVVDSIPTCIEFKGFDYDDIGEIYAELNDYLQSPYKMVNLI